MINITYPNTNIYITNGSTGTTITPTSVTTPSINTQRISTITGTGAAGNILSKTNDNISWISTSASGNIGSSNLDMQTNNITNANTISCTTIDPTTISTTTFANQTTFTTAPTSVDPTDSTHLATKYYVDTKLSTNKNYYLYLNTSQFFTIGSTGYYELSTTMTGVTGKGISGSTVTTTSLIGAFMTPALNITNIPPSLWILNLYCGLLNVSETTGVFSTYFELYKYTTTGAIGMGTSSTAGDINVFPSNYPSLYKMTLSVSSPISLLTTDRLIIKLYYYSTHASTEYYTYYENNWYSYLEILSNFSSTSIGSTASTAISDLNMNNFNITSTGDMTVSCSANILSLGNKSSTINIGTDTSVTTNANLGLTGTNYIYLGCPLTPTYTQLPGEGQIGQIINYPRVLGKTGISSGSNDNIMNYTLPYYGRWLITATIGIYMLTGSKIYYTGLYLSTTNTSAVNGAIVRSNAFSYNQAALTVDKYCNVQNIIGILTNDDIRYPNGFFIRGYYLGATIDKCFTYNDPSDLYIVQAVRLA